MHFWHDHRGLSPDILFDSFLMTSCPLYRAFAVHLGVPSTIKDLTPFKQTHYYGFGQLCLPSLCATALLLSIYMSASLNPKTST